MAVALVKRDTTDILDFRGFVVQTMIQKAKKTKYSFVNNLLGPRNFYLNEFSHEWLNFHPIVTP